MDIKLVHNVLDEAIVYASEEIKDCKIKSLTVYQELIYERFNTLFLSKGLSPKDIKKAWNSNYVQSKLTPFF